MSLVNKYIDSVSFLTATAVYDDVNLTTKSADGYYQSGGQYRQQVSGFLLSSTVCSDCFDYDSLDYVSTTPGDLCCLGQTATQYYYPTGSTFLTTTNIYTDVNLSSIAADGYYSEPNGSQYREIASSSLGSLTSCPSCYTAVTLDFNTTANDLCCVSQTSGTYYVDYGTTLYTTSGLYSDSIGTAAGTGFYKTSASTNYREQVGSSLGGSAACPGCSAVKYTIEACGTLLLYTVVNTWTFSLNDVVQFQVGTPGAGAVYCGTITNINSSGTADASLASAQTYGCGDVVHCAT